jgi:cobalt-zinc-cadmium efflux system outer membrane protein
MTSVRIPLVALFCLFAGCETVERHEAGVGQSEIEGSVSSRIGHNITPLPSLQPLPHDTETYVRQEAYVEPAEPVIETEPLETPTPTPLALDELTLGQLEGTALSFNPALAEVRARVEALRGKWVQVGLPPNTVLGYSGQQLSSHGEAEQQGVFVQQELVRGGKLRLNRAVVSREIEHAEQLLAAQQQRVLTDVRLEFYGVLVAQRRSETTQQLVQIAKEGITTAEALFKAGEVSRVDVMRARIEWQAADLLHKNSRNQYVAAWSRLAAVLGQPDIEPTPLVGDLETAAGVIDPDEALARLVSASPEMAMVLTEAERGRWAVDRAYAEPTPNLDVQAIFQSDNGTGSSNGSLLVSMPIPWLNHNQGGIRQAHAELTAAERAVDRLELSLKQRLAGVYQRYASARNQVEDYSKPDGILANSKTTLEFVRKGYQAGEIGYLDLLTAQRTYSQTNLAYIESLGELWAAVVEIEGLLLKGSLESTRVAMP